MREEDAVSNGPGQNNEDFSALVAGAEAVGPGQPERWIGVPEDPRSFVFDLDSDLAKLVTLTPGPDGIDVAVSYATDTVLERERSLIAAGSGTTITADPFGLVIEWREPLFPAFGWPMVRRRRRF